jgi:hypothetical protein
MKRKKTDCFPGVLRRSDEGGGIRSGNGVVDGKSKYLASHVDVSEEIEGKSRRWMARKRREDSEP